MKAKKYILSLAMVYMAYFTHGIRGDHIVTEPGELLYPVGIHRRCRRRGSRVFGNYGNRLWKNADRVAWRRIFRPDRAEENGNRRWNPLYHLFCRTFVHF